MKQVIQPSGIQAMTIALWTANQNETTQRTTVVSRFTHEGLRLNLLQVITSFNPLKTKRVCFVQGFSACRAVNTLHFSYKNQSLNVL
jgi:hypothetical protein